MKKVIEVLNNEGKKIKINEYRFNPEFHERIGKGVSGSVTPKVEPTLPAFEFNGREYRTESAMKAAITKFNKIN